MLPFTLQANIFLPLLGKKSTVVPGPERAMLLRSWLRKQSIAGRPVYVKTQRPDNRRLEQVKLGRQPPRRARSRYHHQARNGSGSERNSPPIRIPEWRAQAASRHRSAARARAARSSGPPALAAAAVLAAPRPRLAKRPCFVALLK